MQSMAHTFISICLILIQAKVCVHYFQLWPTLHEKWSGVLRTFKICYAHVYAWDLGLKSQYEKQGMDSE